MSNSSIQKSFYAELRTVIRQFACLSPDSSSLDGRFKCDEDPFEWRLEYELSKTSDNVNIVSFYLHCDSEDDLNECGTVIVYPILEFRHPPAYTFYCPPLTFNKNQRCCQLSSFTRKQLLSYLVQDSLSLTLKLNYMRKQLIVENSDTNLIENDATTSKSSLSKDLKEIRINGHLSDVTLSVKGKDFQSHKVILSARSSVFSAMFANDMRENEKNHVEITDVEQEPFEEMLNYIYTGEMPNLHESAFELLPLADKYDLKELKNACEEILLEKLTAENANKILKLVDMHNSAKLRKHILRFIKERAAIEEDFESTEFENVLDTSSPQLLKEMVLVLLKK